MKRRRTLSGIRHATGQNSAPTAARYIQRGRVEYKAEGRLWNEDIANLLVVVDAVTTLRVYAIVDSTAVSCGSFVCWKVGCSDMWAPIDADVI